ncbi:MAG: nucleoside kinase [Clostridiales bacterium]|nr:nucleoside kinase [Clostridiales bacterium]
MVAYKLDEINDMARNNPEELIKKCDSIYHDRVVHAADLITDNLSKSPIVLISGPSGSGKTTTSKKIEEELRSRGIMTHALAMDSYFRTVNEDSPKTQDGKIDLESPHCVDMDLLTEHFNMLRNGASIDVPKYIFSEQRRADKPSQTLQIGKNDVVVVEGIHALNDELTDAHPDALKLYISARSNVKEEDGSVCFKGTWMRLVRRVVRDYKFRGATPEYTLSLWANVRRGEKLNISPFKDKAALKFDSSFAYEVCVMKTIAEDLFRGVPEGTPRYQELRSIVPAFDKFEAIDPTLVAPESLLREFIGGGIYKY